MKRIPIYLVTVFFMVMALGGCSKGEESGDSPDPSNNKENKITHVVQESELSSLSDQEIVLKENKSLQKGDIMVSGANEKAPYGFLRKATAITHSNGKTTIKTDTATLEEAMGQMLAPGQEETLEFDYTFSNTPIGSKSKSEEIKSVVLTIDESFKVDNSTLSLKGSLTLTPNIKSNIGFVKNASGLPEFVSMYFITVTNTDLEVTASASIKTKFQKEFKLGTIKGPPITIQVGLPVVIVPILDVYIGAEGNLKATMAYTYSNKAKITAGIARSDAWKFPESNGMIIEEEGVESNQKVEGSLKLYAKPQFSLAFYDEDFVSTGINVEPYVRYDGTLTAEGYDWEVNAGITSGAYFSAKVFGKSLVDKTWEDILQTQETLLAEGVFNVGYLDNPSPQIGAVVNSQPITFSWDALNFKEKPKFEVFLAKKSEDENVQELEWIATVAEQNHTLSSALESGEYQWRVDAVDANGKLVSKGIVYGFTVNQAALVIEAPFSPVPNDGATNVAIDQPLRFEPGANSPENAVYQAYIQAPNNGFVGPFETTDNGILFDLEYGTAYNWKVETLIEGKVVASSPIWSFTTADIGDVVAVHSPLPNNGAGQIPTTGSLNFSKGANTPQDYQFSLYLGVTPNPDSFINLQGNTTYNYENLQPNETYYWQVKTLDPSGQTQAVSPVWSFTTENNTIGGIFTGDVELRTQEQVNAFVANRYTEIHGNLFLRSVEFSASSDIHDLSGFKDLIRVTGDFEIYRLGNLITLTGLSALVEVNGTLVISKNRSLTSLSGLDQLSMVGGDFEIHDLDSLTALTGLSSLVEVVGSLYISENNSLTDLSGLDQLNLVRGNLGIEDNSQLQNLNGLENLQTIGRDLGVFGNNTLLNIDALNGLTSVGKSIYIGNPKSGYPSDGNGSLESIEGLQNVTSVGKDITIADSGVLSLSGLENITTINGTLQLKNCPFTNLNGLENLQSAEKIEIIQPNLESLSSLSSLVSLNELVVHGTKITEVSGLSGLTSLNVLDLLNNQQLSNLDDFQNLSNIGELEITNAPAITSLNAFSAVSQIKKAVFYNLGLEYLDGFSGVTDIELLKIYNCANLRDIQAFSNLMSADEIRIKDNSVLEHMTALQNMVTISDDLQIDNNDSLENLVDFSSLQSVGSLWIRDNDAMSQGLGLSRLSSITQSLRIENNSSLLDLSGLDNVQTVGNDVYILNNILLTSLSGIDAITSVGDDVVIRDNSALVNYCALSLLFNNNGLGDRFSLENNGYNPSITAMQAGNCQN